MSSWQNFLVSLLSRPPYNLSTTEIAVVLAKFPDEDEKHIKPDKAVAEQATQENNLPCYRETVSKHMRTIYTERLSSREDRQDAPNLEGKRGQERDPIFHTWLKHKYLELQEAQSLASVSSGETDIEIDWREVCREVLENQNQWLTTHALGSGNRRVKDMYVPLGLVERKEKPRPEPSISPERGSEFYQEKITPIEHKDFFEQVLKQGISPENNGRRIAIIGEPGAGKTTLLQEIASRVEGLPIWVDLAELNPQVEDCLENYLLQKWLDKKASSVIRRLLPEVVLSQEELKKAFKEAFYQNAVWLLLDGANEIPANLSNPLTWIDKQIREGWISEARVVLTCRLNVGDIHNDLPGFDIYCNRDFSYPEQVEEFIDKWFVKKAEQESRDNLKAELRRASERIQNLIKNPLRLMLLCHTCEDGVKLKNITKAELYHRLVKGLYKLKDRDNNPKFKIDRNRQEELKCKLGKLALQAIDSNDARFRLRESSIEEFLGYPDQEDSLFWIARELGWLNQVGLPMVEEKDSDEKVYAFFHPTFQEYFAACVIPDWDFFLPRDHIDRPVKDKDNLGNYRRYRIFEPHWREVILLWMGLEKDETFRIQKEHFIERLLNFADTCHDFYWYRAYFLAAATITEIGDFYRHDEIVEQLVEWGFCDNHFSKVPVGGARTALRDINHSKVITEVTKMLHSCQDDWTRFQIAGNLWRVAPGNQDAKDFFIRLLNSDTNDLIRYSTALVLLDNDPENLEAIATLHHLSSTTEDQAVLFAVDVTLSQLFPNNSGKSDTLDTWIREHQIAEDNITELICIIPSPNNPSGSFRIKLEIPYIKSELLNALDCLSNELDRGIDSLLEVLFNTQNNYEYHLVRRVLLWIGIWDERVIGILSQWLEIIQDQNIKIELATLMLQIEPNHLDATQSLIFILHNTQDKEICQSAANNLEINVGDNLIPEVVKGLKDCLTEHINKNNLHLYKCCSHVLWKCARNMPYPEFYQAWHSENSTFPTEVQTIELKT